MRFRPVFAVFAAALVAVWVSGCGSGRPTSASSGHLTGTISVVLKPNELAIYDPTGHSAVAITKADVIRSSVRLARSTGSADVYVGLTAAGEARLCRLTRAVAQLGARLHREQHLNVQVGGHIYARPKINYRLFPAGICGAPGLEFGGLSPARARMLVRRIRAG